MILQYVQGCNLVSRQTDRLHGNWWPLIKTAASHWYGSWKIEAETLSKLVSESKRKTSWGRQAGRGRLWLDKLREGLCSAWGPLITATVQNNLSLPLSSSPIQTLSGTCSITGPDLHQAQGNPTLHIQSSSPQTGVDPPASHPVITLHI